MWYCAQNSTDTEFQTVMYGSAILPTLVYTFARLPIERGYNNGKTYVIKLRVGQITCYN